MNKSPKCKTISFNKSLSFDRSGTNETEYSKAHNTKDELKKDLNSGYVLTDIDNGNQRALFLSKNVFIYKEEINGETHEMVIDTSKINCDEAVMGFYKNESEVREEYGEAANMIIAECYFENNT